MAAERGELVPRGDGRRRHRTACASSLTTRRRTTASTTWSPTRLSGSCSTTSGVLAPRPTSAQAPRSVERRVRARERGVRQSHARGARPRARCGRPVPRLPPLPRPATRPGGAARTSSHRISSISPGRSRTTGTRCPKELRVSRSRGAARKRRRRLPHRALAASVPASRRSGCSARVSTRTRGRSSTRATRPVSSRGRSVSTPSEFDAAAERAGRARARGSA